MDLRSAAMKRIWVFVPSAESVAFSLVLNLSEWNFFSFASRFARRTHLTSTPTPLLSPLLVNKLLVIYECIGWIMSFVDWTRATMNSIRWFHSHQNNGIYCCCFIAGTSTDSLSSKWAIGRAALRYLSLIFVQRLKCVNSIYTLF